MKGTLSLFLLFTKNSRLFFLTKWHWPFVKTALCWHLHQGSRDHNGGSSNYVGSIINWEEPSSGGLMETCPVRLEGSSIIKWRLFSRLHTAWPSSGLQHGCFSAIYCKTTGDTAWVSARDGFNQLEGLCEIAAEPQVSWKSIEVPM